MKPFFHLLYGLALLLAPFTSSTTGLIPITDAWRVGFLVQQPSGLAMEGRLAMVAAEVQTARDPVDTYFAFPAAASKRWVRDAKFYLLARSGSYTDEVQMTLAVYDSAGSLRRVVSRSIVNLQTAPVSQWTALEVSTAASDRLVSDGEILAFHFAMPGGKGGNMVLQPVFEVTVESFTRTYLPEIWR